MPRPEKRPEKRKRPLSARREPKKKRKPRLTKAEKLRRARISRALRAFHKEKRRRREEARARAKRRRDEARERRRLEKERKERLAHEARERRWEKKLAEVGGIMVKKFANAVEEGRPTHVVKAAVTLYYETKAMLRAQAHSTDQYLKVLRRIQEALSLDRLGWNIVY
jgi:hypothetical protein